MFGRFARVAVVVCSALLLIGLTVGYAVAHCSGCINATDLAADSVGTSELQAGAVHTSDMASGAVTNSRLANYSVSLGKVDATARVRVGQVNFLSTSKTGSAAQELAHFNVTAPAAGVLYVSLKGVYYIDNDAGSASAVMSDAYVGLCDATASMTGCSFNDNNGRGTDLYVVDPDDAQGTNQTPSFQFSTVVPVTAGVRTFYVNVANISGGTFYLFYGSHADVMFVPGVPLPITTT